MAKITLMTSQGSDTLTAMFSRHGSTVITRARQLHMAYTPLVLSVGVVTVFFTQAAVEKWRLVLPSSTQCE